MAPLFGPLAGSGSFDPAYMYDSQAYPSAPIYSGLPGTGSNQDLYRRMYGPIRSGPPVRSFDPLMAYQNPSPFGMIGYQITRPDRLFGPFASFGAGPAGPSGL
jgi:hypothetical protein